MPGALGSFNLFGSAATGGTGGTGGGTIPTDPIIDGDQWLDATPGANPGTVGAAGGAVLFADSVNVLTLTGVTLRPAGTVRNTATVQVVLQRHDRAPVAGLTTLTLAPLGGGAYSAKINLAGKIAEGEAYILAFSVVDGSGATQVTRSLELAVTAA